MNAEQQQDDVEELDDRPRLAVIVGNGITGDSRVQKTAIAAAREGWRVLLLGRSRSGRVERSWMGPIEVVRVPVWHNVRRQVAHDRERGLRSLVTRFRLDDSEALKRYQAAHRTWDRAQSAEVGTLTREGRAALRRNTLKAVLRARRTVYRARNWAYRWEGRHQADPAVPVGEWRQDWPELLDLDLAFGPAIEKFRPHVIHANDVTMLVPAAHSAARLWASGHRCSWIYDSHEYVAGVEWGNPLRHAAYPALESEFIGRADAVVTVSPEIAELLREAHGLSETPLVVANTPVREAVGVDVPGTGVRGLCGLDESVPLLVYAGWVDRQRGLETVVAGLGELPEVHLALVTNRQNPFVQELLDQAAEVGAADRVHVLPYVPQHAVADYIASADLGLIPFRRTPNCELSLPTKMAEYLHAGLPVLASDVKTVRAFTEEHGIGEIFTAGDAVSFAEAAAKAVACRDSLAERITEPLLAELSWEAQSGALLDLYRRLAGTGPEVARPDVPWTVTEQVQRPAESEDGTASFNRWRPLDASGEDGVRLGMGIANYAGQLAAFASAVSRERDDVSCEVVMASSATGFGYPADAYLDNARLGSVDVQVEQVRRVLSGRYTHLLADAFRPVLGTLNGDHIGADLPALRSAGLKVALLAHGSEIRHPGRHMERHAESLFFDAPDDQRALMTAIAERNRRTAADSGLPVFVTTPDLLVDLPWATWTPLVVDVDSWASDAPVLERKRPVVVHAPSKRWTKGSGRILPVLEELHDKGAIDFQLLEGVPWEEVRRRIKSADIVVDQFAIGAYGTFSCEAMAAGRPVLCYISDEVSSLTGPLPIVNATSATLREAVESLLDDRAAGARIGAESLAFVRENHDGRRTAAALSSFLQ
ncbi:glycosyltransferase [Streptacidiphilus anmyonensis]|uniref:glycosyltransferase n=1 Tax=Streptacidiphilus anmyonensis TaxID=405782 RepID=UPI001F1A0878|nr:glycosyltransferase [Streptacidiphilus anmyonensis]